MDLISKEQALGFLNDLFGEMQTVTFNDVLQSFEKLPLAFAGMTNGEVIKALFPNGKVIECDEATGYEQMLDEENSYCSWFDSLWWNAPYKGVSE